jgi:hypothetical protein
LKALEEVQQFPERAKMKEWQNEFPLQVACLSYTSKEIIMALVTLFPEALKHKDRQGDYPIDLFLANYSDYWYFDETQSFEVISVMIQVDSMSIQRINSLGDYPLRTACYNDVDLKGDCLYMKLIETYPAATGHANAAGY